jgi:hypothetical protein
MLRHDAAPWQEKSRGFSLAAEDGFHVARFNRIFWKGMRAMAFPTLLSPIDGNHEGAGSAC